MPPKKQGAHVRWAPVQPVVPVVPPTAVAALPAEEDGSAGSETASAVSTIAGDSLHSEADCPDAAVAASDSGDRPRSKARQQRPKRETASVNVAAAALAK